MSGYSIRVIVDADSGWLCEFMRQRWGSAFVVSRGQMHEPGRLPGFIAEQDSRVVGVATYHVSGAACELMTLDSLVEGQGIGVALINAVKTAARASGCVRLWLITTNDNIDALRFYQKRGFRLVAVYPDAIARSRKLKPEIPLIGAYDLPIRDEIELEMRLDDA